MVSQHRLLRQVPVLMGLFVILFALTGCPLSPGDDSSGGGDETRLPPRDSVDNAVEFYRVVWEQTLYDEYTELLHPEFEYFFLSSDADDFPWVPGDSWGRSEELGMAANMFNPDFDPPSGSGAGRVQSIEMELTKRSERSLPEGVIEVVYSVEATVLFNSTDGYFTNAVFVFEVVQGSDGLWQLIAQRERELL